MLLVRISSPKQIKEGDSPEYQIARGLADAEKRFGYSREEVFILTETFSGRKEERPSLDQALILVEQMKLERLLFFDIDRLTRAGPGFYEQVKRKFHNLGCEIVDVKGIIQPASNSLEGTGGSFGQDFTYDWSVYAASEKAEVMEAQSAKDEARKILGRTIPIQIKNAQLGRTNRWAPYGYRNVKIVDDSGKPQPSKKIDESEAFFIRRMFVGMAAGRSTRAICDELNDLGYRTRKRRMWNADFTKVVSVTGEKSLTPDGVQRAIQRVVYAGFIMEKWTHGLPVLANHRGIVTVDLWNKANKGKWLLEKQAASPTGWSLRDTSEGRRSYNMEREEFPLKRHVLCQVCQSPFKGSFSKGKMGKRYGYYHCARGHKQVAINHQKLHSIARQLLKDLKFDAETSEALENHIRAVWIEKVGDLNTRLASMNKDLAELRTEANSLFEKIKVASSPLIIKRLEEDYEKISHQIQKLESRRDEGELSDREISKVIKWARFMVEHLDELLLDGHDKRLKPVFWDLVFPRPPTLAEMQSGTPELSPLIGFKEGFQKQENTLVTRKQFGSNFFYQELGRWAKALSTIAKHSDKLVDEWLLVTDNSYPNEIGTRSF